MHKPSPIVKSYAKEVVCPWLEPMELKRHRLYGWKQDAEAKQSKRGRMKEKYRCGWQPCHPVRCQHDVVYIRTILDYCYRFAFSLIMVNRGVYERREFK